MHSSGLGPLCGVCLFTTQFVNSLYVIPPFEEYTSSLSIPPLGPGVPTLMYISRLIAHNTESRPPQIDMAILILSSLRFNPILSKNVRILSDGLFGTCNVICVCVCVLNNLRDQPLTNTTSTYRIVNLRTRERCSDTLRIELSLTVG